MLAKSPDERYASATDVLADLRAQQTGSGTVPVAVATPRRSWHIGRVIALALIVIVVLALVPVVRQQWKRRFVGSELPEKKNLAVLPFMVVGEDPGAHAFAQGLAETLTGKLSQLTDNYPLQVVPPSEIRSQKVSSVEQARVGVGANLVLEGSLQRSGSLVRVTYHLVDARNRQQLRADIVTAQAADPFAVEDRVVQSVVRSLDLELGAKERQALRARGTAEPAAYDYYLRGRGYLMEYQNPENVDSAIEVFRRSLESDPKYTLAYAGLGESYWHKYEASHASEWVAKALDNCEKAAALGEGAICLGHVYNETGKYEKAADEFQRALQLDSTSDDAYRGLAFANEHLGKTAEAEQTYRHAIAVRPQYWAGYNWLGTFLFRQGRFDEAARSFLQVTTLAPDSYRGYQNLGGAYTAMGRFSEALPALERSVQVRPTSTAYSNLGTVYFYLGRFPEAARTNEQAVKLDGRNYVLWGNLADAYFWTPGERDKAPAAYVNARSLAEEQLKINPRDASALGQVALDHAMLRERDAASQNIQHALALAPADPDLQLKAAIIALQFGNSEQSINYVGKALDAGLSPVLVKDHPAFATLRSDKRFVQILTGHSSKQP
jgi:tetratricopeptide (TPR) repeat protein